MAESMESAVNDAFTAVIAWQREAREALWRAPSRRQVEATIRAQFDRAEAAGARLAEVRRTVTTFKTHYAGTLDDQAADVICAVLQVLDGVPLGTQERNDGKEADRG